MACLLSCSLNSWREKEVGVFTERPPNSGRSVWTAGLHDGEVAVPASFVSGIICPVVLKSDRTDSSHHAWHPHPLSSTLTPPPLHPLCAMCCPEGGWRSCLCVRPEELLSWEGGRQKQPPLLCSSFTSHFSDKHLLLSFL